MIKNNSDQNISFDDYQAMLSENRLILKGRRWRKFNMFSFFALIIALSISIACLIKIFKANDWQLQVFMLMPILFLIYWFPHKKKELEFHEIITNSGKENNYKMALRAINKLNWTVGNKTSLFIEAFTKYGLERTWGCDMMSILIDDNRILVNSICNLERGDNQAFFTFGKFKKNVRTFAAIIQEEINNLNNIK